jgi:hypothetical protein
MADEAETGATTGATREAAPAADDYQARYMAGSALYHDKIRAPRAYHLIFLLPLLVVLASSLVAAAQAGPAALLAPAFSLVVLPLVWLLFSVLRITVTRQEVYVQYGLFGPKIPVRDIEHAAAVDYDWKKYGGWGIRYGRDGSVAYNMLGDGGRAVEIVYKKGNRSRKVLVASTDPARLAGAIQEARALAAGSAPPARIAAPAAVEEKDELTRQAETEAEALAAEAEAEARRQA